MIREVLQDVVNHTGALEIIQVVKISGTEKETNIEAMDENKTLVLKGKLNEPVAEFQGEFGMFELMTNLSPMLNFPNHKSDEAKWTVKRRTKGETEIPEEINVIDKEGITTRYRLMAAELVPEQAKLLLKEWDVTVTPTKDKIQEFSARAALVPQESYFMVKTIKDELRFYFGDENAASHGTAMQFSKGIKGSLPEGLYWPVDQVKKVLKFGMDTDIKVSFAAKGAMLVEAKSGYATWKYILPCRRK